MSTAIEQFKKKTQIHRMLASDIYTEELQFCDCNVSFRNVCMTTCYIPENNVKWYLSVYVCKCCFYEGTLDVPF